MSKLSKRTLLGWASVAALTALVGCGKKEEPAAPAAAPAAAPVAAASAPGEPLKAAWVLLGPIGDAGWTHAHYQGIKAVEEAFGNKVKVTYVEKVPESADAERVLRDLASQGNKIIFTTSFGYMDATVKVAAEFPDVMFEHATGYKLAPNLGVYDHRSYQDAYISGIIAGAMTKTNTLGFVATFPIPEVLRNINAYTLGAQSVNPNIKTKVVWISTWFDPPKEAEAAQSLINAGADVLLQNTDSSAVLQTAEKNGKYAFGWDSDMSAIAPKAHLASNVLYWGPFYKKAIQDMLDGTWKSSREVWGYKEGANAVIKIADVVPEAAKKKIEEVEAGYKDGTMDPFKGPIVDNTGKERLAAGAMPTQDWKDKVDFYVKGVDGQIPTGK